jgi:hypothetical protein
MLCWKHEKGKMTRNASIRVTFIIVCIIIFFGCSKNASREVDFGTIENSVYRNKYFGLTITIPAEWSIQDQESRQRIVETGTEIMAGEDKNLKAVIKASELQVVNLLFAFKHPLGTPVTSNPSIACIAERIRQTPGIKRGKDYHFHARKLLESSQMDVSFPRDISSVKLGDVDFDIMYVQMALPGITVQQEYYATVMKDYALSFVVSFSNEKEKAELGKILDSIVLKQ